MDQRPIKFRIAITSPHWDEEPDNTKLSEPLMLGEVIDREQIDFTDGGYIDWNDIDWETDTVRYLQFTGLKEGETEVYEGDILRVPEHYEGDSLFPEDIYIVEFGDAEFYLFGGKNHYLDLWNALVNDRAHVIGNAIENGELLNA